MISKIFHKSFQTAKRIRSETDVASGAVSIASAAVETALSLVGSLSGYRGLIIGAGEMASLLAGHLKSKGVSLTIASRSRESAQELAAKVGSEILDLNDIASILGEVDIVATATGGSEPVLSETLLAQASAKLLILDLGLPRNVQESAALLPNITLKNIDDFKAVVQQNQSSRQGEAEKAEIIIQQEVSKFSHWLSSLSASPTIKDLIRKAEEARQVELERTMARNSFSPEQIEALEAMGRALVRRVLHYPLTFAKGCHRHGRTDQSLEIFRRVFGLDH
jgi:glutamyl-tRNA reductase